MAHEILVKRTIYVSKCKHDKKVLERNPPKERFCTECSKWIPYKEISYTGKDLSNVGR